MRIIQCKTCGHVGTARPRSQGEPRVDAAPAMVCRYNPPALNGWPRVEPDDWCDRYHKIIRPEDVGR